MALGDTASVVLIAAAAGVLAVQPAGTVEWVIHNIYYGGSVQVLITDGTNPITVFSDTTAGALLNCQFHVTNTKFVQIKNNSGGALFFSFDGVVTHV